jgi:PAS domain S-box-containing protein
MRAGADDGLFACDPTGTISHCDAAAAAFLGSRRRPTGRSLAELLDGLDDQTLSLRFQSALRDPSSLEFVVSRPRGDDEWVEVRTLPLESGMAFLLRDVTDRERSERGLRRKERRLRTINESLRLAHHAARAASWEWLGGGPVRWLEPGAARALIGLPVEASDDEAIADWRAFVAPEDLATVDAALRDLATRDEVSFEYRVAAADGGRHWLRSSAAVIERRPDGGPLRVSGVTLDITHQKLSEAKLQREIQERSRAEERQQLLIHELNHRVKNMLATVQSMARQSLGGTVGAGELADFENRLMALAWAHDILTRESWAGAQLSTVVARTMSPHADASRLDIKGPDLWLPPQTALALAMGVHELATNAVKYGALSTAAGRVSIHWKLEPGRTSTRLVLAWAEQGGPPVSPPHGRGFGSRLLERGLARELGGAVTLSFDRGGVRCRIEAPLPPDADASEPPPTEADVRDGPAH